MGRVDNDPRYRGNYDPPEIRSAPQRERWVCRDGCEVQLSRHLPSDFPD